MYPVKLTKQEFLTRLHTFKNYWMDINSIKAKNYAGTASCVIWHFESCDHGNPCATEEQKNRHWESTYDNLCDKYLKYAADCHYKSDTDACQTRQDHIDTADAFMAIRSMLIDD